MANGQDNYKSGKTKEWNGVGMSRKHDAFNTGTKKFTATSSKKGSKKQCFQKENLQILIKLNLASGACTSYDDYRYVVGIVEGLEKSKAILKNIANKYQEKEE